MARQNLAKRKALTRPKSKPEFLNVVSFSIPERVMAAGLAKLRKMDSPERLYTVATRLLTEWCMQ